MKDRLLEQALAQKKLARKPATLEIHYEPHDLSKGDLEKLRRVGARYNAVRGHAYKRFVKTRDTSVLRKVLEKGESRTVIVRFQYGYGEVRDLVLRARTVEYVLREYMKAERARRKVCPDCSARHRQPSPYSDRCPSCEAKHRELITQYRLGKAAVDMVEHLWPALKGWFQ